MYNCKLIISGDDGAHHFALSLAEALRCLEVVHLGYAHPQGLQEAGAVQSGALAAGQVADVVNVPQRDPLSGRGRVRGQ